MNKLTCFLCGALLLLASFGTACQQPSAATNNSTPAGSPVANAAGAPAPAATQNPEDAVPRTKVEDAKAEIAKGTAVLLDVRGTETYKTSHLKGSLDYPLSRLEQKDFKDIPQGKHLIAYCAWPAEHTSARAALLLQNAGYKASALLGGVSAWEAAGGEMVKAPPASPSPANPPGAAPEAKSPAGKKP